MAESDEVLRFLQKVDLTGNKIKAIPQLIVPALFRLILDENEIALCKLKSHNSLSVLSLNKNKMTNCQGLSGLKNLQDLSV